jgi:hypothetical protein
MYMNQVWPRLELTKEEMEYCRNYDGRYPTDEVGPDGKKKWKLFPGVRRRTYVNQLVNTTFTDETSVFQQNFSPSGRRTRVFAFTFSGYIAAWQIKIFSTSGELWVQDFTTITALCNGAPRAPAGGFGMQSEVLVGESKFTLLQQGVIPYRRDPNILLGGTQELVFQGQTLVAPAASNGRFVLNIATHVWEFPDMPRADGEDSRSGTAAGEQ